MLFNSFAFLFGYAPIVILGFFLLSARNLRLGCAWLGLMSLVFYAWWYPPHTLILLASIVFNFIAGILISRAGEVGSASRKQVLIIALIFNLGALCYYKYFGFFGSAASQALGLHWTIGHIALPLGISFFTFTQIAYLVDTYQAKVKEHDFIRYLLFVTYFPHLVAGPIIHHKDVMTQFGRRETFSFNRENFSAGGVMFIIGLFKKIVIADSIATLNTTVFTLAEQGAPIHTGSAWAAAIGYALQLYFDFSGYSDMAIGLSMMLNVRLPFNFDSPYKSRSIVDFWRRWHISLSTFLRDYLYIPLGGNRHGTARRYLNMGVTMVLGGLWHGAGWTFIIWGALHGTYLAINHAWRGATEQASFRRLPMYEVVCWLVTFLAVLFAWVFFRAQTLAGALHLLTAMLGMGGTAVAQLPLGEGVMVSLPLTFVCLLSLLAIVIWAPNSQQITASLMEQPDHFNATRAHVSVEPLKWRPVPWRYALVLGVMLAASLALMSQPSEFLYFNF